MQYLSGNTPASSVKSKSTTKMPLFSVILFKSVLYYWLLISDALMYKYNFIVVAGRGGASLR